MSERRNSLNPPERGRQEDPGAHELDTSTSDSDEHFSDAQSAPSDSHPPSPIPKTRVEKVDDDPSHGEVPGTEAYRMRENDAEPDEIAVIPDASRTSSLSSLGNESHPATPSGQAVPVTIVEKTSDSDGSMTHPEIQKKHKADPPPDLVLEPGEKGAKGEEKDSEVPESLVSPQLKTPSSTRSRRKSSLAKKTATSPSFAGPPTPGADDCQEEGDEFGDDFDEFEEGGDDAEFGDFDDGFQQPEEQADMSSTPTRTAVPPPPSVAPSLLSFPIPDFVGLDSDEIFATTDPYINALFPPDELDTPPFPPLSKENPIFLTPRSASLWSQLVAPPPLQPPDWIRSRIRRLFLVSLGVPVDLDEILPASKQKKLVLPSLRPVSSSGSLRVSGDRRSLSRLRRDGANTSSTSVDSQGRAVARAGSTGGESGNGNGTGAPSKKRKAHETAPDFDLVAAEQVCTTTDEALNGMTDDELRKHIARMSAMQETATKVLNYWQKRTDEKIGDRDAFEGVIENLVKHARKVRQ